MVANKSCRGDSKDVSGAYSKPSLETAFVFVDFGPWDRYIMEKKFLTSSKDSSVWMAISVLISWVILLVTGLSRMFPTFYHTATIQGLSNIALYADVTSDQYSGPTLWAAYITRVFSVAAFLASMVFYWCASAEIDQESTGYTWKMALETENMCVFIAFLLAIPLLQAATEIVIRFLFKPKK